MTTELPDANVIAGRRGSESRRSRSDVYPKQTLKCKEAPKGEMTQIRATLIVVGLAGLSIVRDVILLSEQCEPLHSSPPSDLPRIDASVRWHRQSSLHPTAYF